MTADEARALNEQLQRGYQITFGGPGDKIVLADLIAFCFGRQSTFDPNDRIHARNEGRREVLMRIVEMTNLSLEEIYQMRGVTRPRTGDRDDN